MAESTLEKQNSFEPKSTEFEKIGKNYFLENCKICKFINEKYQYFSKFREDTY